MFATRLPCESKATDLFGRILWIVNDDVVTDSGSGKISVHDLRLKEIAGERHRLIALQSWFEIFAHEFLECIAFGIASAPRQPVEAAQIKAWPQRAQVKITQCTHPPEWWNGRHNDI